MAAAAGELTLGSIGAGGKGGGARPSPVDAARRGRAREGVGASTLRACVLRDVREGKGQSSHDVREG
jgi:hypothetical protein